MENRKEYFPRKGGALTLGKKTWKFSPRLKHPKQEMNAEAIRKEYFNVAEPKIVPAETFRAIWEEVGHIWVAESCLKKGKKADSRYYNCRMKSNHISRKGKEKGSVRVAEQAQGDVARKKRKRTEGVYNLCSSRLTIKYLKGICYLLR